MDEIQSPSDDAAPPDLNLAPGDLDSPDFDLPNSDLQDNDLEDSDLEGDTLREECGVFGIFGHPEAAAITALGLHALQHRGQEAAGIVSFDGTRFHSERRLGLVGDTFSRREVIDRLPGNAAVGHVRYSTTGATILRNVQPLFAELNAGGFAVGHNGNLTNGLTLRRDLVRNGAMMQSTTDTEVILHLVAQSKRNRFIDRFIEALRAIEGAYSLVSLTNKKLIGARDPLGIRPLVLGELGGCPILASETCALDIIGAKYVRDVEPGEVIVFDERGAQSHKPFPPKPPRPCIFEYIYFSRPDSIVGGRSVYEVRKAFGAQLARESHVEVDVVVPVPDSGVPAAVGYSQHSGVPFELGIIRNHYVGRTFIQPTQSVRELGVRMKHNANRAAIEGKRIILIDDSLVRGTTSKKIVRMMRDAGAREVHFRLASPPIIHPDYYGIDLPDRGGLLAATHNLEQMREIIGADSLAFLSIDGMYRAMGEPGRDPANSRIIALPAPIRPTSPIRPRSSRSRGNCRSWRKRASSRPRGTRGPITRSCRCLSRNRNEHLFRLSPSRRMGPRVRGDDC
jgi:amidophosphoribosyltransferase